MTERAVDADAFNAFEAAGWEKQAATYEDLLGSITARLAEPLLDAAEVGRGVRVLDVASGPGYVAAAVASRGASVVGVDIAEAMLSRARRLHPELEFHQGDAQALRFPDTSFDAVVANFLLLHLGRPEKAVAEFARVLAPGGRLALTVWDLPERAQFLGVLVESLAAAGAVPPEDLPVGPPIFRFSDEREFVGMLEGAGSMTSGCRPSPSLIEPPPRTSSGEASSAAPCGPPRSSSARRKRCSGRSAPPSTTLLAGTRSTPSSSSLSR